MKTKLIIALTALSSCGLLLYSFWSAGPGKPGVLQTQAPKSLEKVPSEKSTLVPQTKNSVQAPLAPAEMTQPSANGVLDVEGKRRLLQTIHEAAISYDPIDLPRIQPYLIHADPEVREAALNGVVVLGHAAGAPMLREAAKKLGNGKEAAQLMEKADYLELPSVPLEVMKARFAKKRAAKSQTLPSGAASGIQSQSK